MKKLLAAFVFVLLCAGLAYGAGTCVETVSTYKDGDFMLTWTCTGDASDGTFPATTSNFRGNNIDGYIYQVVTDPGATAPTASYDITITDANGVDIMGAELENRSATATEQKVPKIGGLYGARRVNGTMTLNITNNSVTAAQVVIKVFGYKK